MKDNAFRFCTIKIAVMQLVRRTCFQGKCISQSCHVMFYIKLRNFIADVLANTRPHNYYNCLIISSCVCVLVCVCVYVCVCVVGGGGGGGGGRNKRFVLKVSVR